MNTRNHFISVMVVFLLIMGFSGIQSAMAHEDHGGDDKLVHAGGEIGVVDFRASCDEPARKDFDRALGLMHHMMYAQARSDFEKITEIYPKCAMAYWGVATTLFQPLWGTRPSEEELERGWQKIQTAQYLQPATEREQLLIKATRGFFREPESASFRTRIDRWAEGMAEAYQANPDDYDTASLYALSLLALGQRETDERDKLHDEAEAILRSVWEEENRHPGAIHYSIHATDVDGRAGNALDMVEVYGEIAPDVPHALHMPSHIYVRLGDWKGVIYWNRRSADIAVEKELNGGISHHYLHAMDYILYGFLQRGEDDKARKILEEAMAKDRHQASFISAYHLAAMPARLAVEQRAWEDALRLEPRSPRYLPWDESLWAEAMTRVARGLGGVQSDDLKTAEESAKQLQKLRDQAKDGGDDSFATYIEIERLILDGWIAKAKGENEKAVELVRSAAELEGTVEKHPVTPGALLPPYEALGDLFMELDRPGDALEAYQDGDEIWPNRYNTILGTARAAKAAGDSSGAGKYYTRLIDMAGESKREGVIEAGRFLAQ